MHTAPTESSCGSVSLTLGIGKDDPKQRYLFPNVRIAAPEQLLDLVAEIPRHLLG